MGERRWDGVKREGREEYRGVSEGSLEEVGVAGNRVK
jgi:hypothetical protein